VVGATPTATPAASTGNPAPGGPILPEDRARNEPAAQDGDESATPREGRSGDA